MQTLHYAGKQAALANQALDVDGFFRYVWAELKTLARLDARLYTFCLVAYSEGMQSGATR